MITLYVHVLRGYPHILDGCMGAPEYMYVLYLETGDESDDALGYEE